MIFDEIFAEYVSCSELLRYQDIHDFAKSDTGKRQTRRLAAQTIRFLYQRKDLSIKNLYEVLQGNSTRE